MCNSKMNTLHIMGLFNLSYATHFYVFWGFLMNAYLVKGISDKKYLVFFTSLAVQVFAETYTDKKYMFIRQNMAYAQNCRICSI